MARNGWHHRTHLGTECINVFVEMYVEKRLYKLGNYLPNLGHDLTQALLQCLPTKTIIVQERKMCIYIFLSAYQLGSFQL